MGFPMPIRYSFRSYALVIIQLLCLGGIVITGPLIASRPITLGLELLGVALGLWALMTLRYFHILPDIRAGSQLVTNGPYRYIRHPMYSALLLVTFALILDVFSLERVFIWVILTGDLWVKLTFEEKILTRHFGEYEAYQKQTKRLIPFLI